MPDIATLQIIETNHQLMIPRRPEPARIADEPRVNRFSRNALQIGRRAEEIVLRYLHEHSGELQASNIRWIAKEGLTPGWDIQYANAAGETISVEVKGL